MDYIQSALVEQIQLASPTNKVAATAEANAALTAKAFVTMAKRAGMDARELWDKYALKIRQGKEMQAGALGQYAGTFARTADKLKYDQAKDMLAKGIDPQEVRKATGWFKGMDGKMRFEIDDSKASVKGINKNNEFNYFRDLFSEWVSGKSKLTVGDFLTHDGLFEAYPWIAQITVLPKDGSGASYNTKTGIISIGKDVSADDLKGTLLHEIQHAIQTEEGFARGGSPDEFAKAYNKLKEMRPRIIKMLREALDAKDTEKFRRILQEDKRVQRQLIALIGKDGLVGVDQYEQLAGEIEARDTAARANMGAQERMENPPARSEGAIVVWNGQEVMYQTSSPADAEAARQKEEVRSRYANAPMWMKAPDGTPTKLTEDQWLMVRTPSFKRWFGDWDYDGTKEVAAVHVVADTSLPLKDTRGLAKTLLARLRDKKVVVRDNGVEVGFYRSGIEAALKNKKPLARQLFSAIENVIENAVYYSNEENTDKENKPGVEAYDTYYSAAIIDGKPYAVRIVVDVVKDMVRGQGYYYHQIKEIDAIDAVGSTRASKAPALTTSINYTLDQLAGNVKPESSKAIDTNGEPLVVYHGTANEFDSFDRKMIGANYFESKDGGFFFTQRKRSAENYAALHSQEKGGNVMQVYLSAKNPLVREVDSDYLAPADFYDMHHGELTREAELSGNDGIVIKGTSGDNLYVAFAPTQSKSVNNRGTFDPSNPNIYKQSYKGSIHWQDGGPVISLFSGADHSTFVHEAGHLFLRMLEDLTTLENAPAQIVQDLQTVRTWGAQQDAAWNIREDGGRFIVSLGAAGMREAATYAQAEDILIQEKFAVGCERYLMEGRAPSEEMRSVFEQFATWLKDLYKTLVSLKVDLTDEVRGVMDRLLAADEEIDSRGPVEPMDAADVLTDSEQAIYAAMAEDARQTAMDRLRSRLVRQLRSEKMSEADAERKRIEELTRQEVADSPVYLAMQALDLPMTEDEQFCLDTCLDFGVRWLLTNGVWNSTTGSPIGWLLLRRGPFFYLVSL